MAGTKHHDYHILPPDIAPLATTIGALTFTSGMVLFMQDLGWEQVEYTSLTGTWGIAAALLGSTLLTQQKPWST